MLKVRELTARRENHPGTLAQIATFDGRCEGEYPRFSSHYVRCQRLGKARGGQREQRQGGA